MNAASGKPLASERELRRGQVDPRVVPAVGERRRHRRGPAPELQHVGAGGKPLEHLVEEPFPDAGLVRRGPVQVPRAESVVALFDDPLGIQFLSPHEAGACSLTRCPRRCNG